MEITYKDIAIKKIVDMPNEHVAKVLIFMDGMDTDLELLRSMTAQQLKELFPVLTEQN